MPVENEEENVKWAFALNGNLMYLAVASLETEY
jgi:hypothetical protein